MYVPKASADDLKKAITEYEAAKATIEFKGTPTTPEGQEARDSMKTRMGSAKVTRNSIIRDVINAAKVIQGGGQELFDLTLKDKVNSAAEISLDRLFPNFQDADDDRWHSVINRAKSGSEAALQAVDWNDAPEKHPVCSAVISEIGSGKKGKDIRDAFESTTYGWPRDAIDAAFITMFTTGHIRVTHKGVQLKQGQLDQAKISVSDFRVETVTIDARARIKLRKQFQSAGIPCKPNEESSAAGQFLALAQNDNWNMISLEQQEDILDTEGIAEIPPLSIGDGSSLISTLEETPLTAWKTKIDALPQQFSNAAFAAAMLLEPKTQNIKLSSGTLKTERDVTNWIERTEQELLAKLEDGPIVIS